MAGNLLGLLPEVQVASAEVVLEAGDMLVMFTDGVLDARKDGVFFDVEGVIDVLAAENTDAATTAAALERAVVAHTGGQLEDDMAVLVLRVPDAS
jgi:serine phosphatase RsbU (regulator of sigma subunit)